MAAASQLPPLRLAAANAGAARSEREQIHDEVRTDDAGWYREDHAEVDRERNYEEDRAEDLEEDQQGKEDNKDHDEDDRERTRIRTTTTTTMTIATSDGEDVPAQTQQSSYSLNTTQGLYIDTCSSQDRIWLRYYNMYTLALIVAALVPVGCWLVLSHTTACRSDATRRDVGGFIFLYNGGYNLLASLTAILTLICQGNGVPTHIQLALYSTAPIGFYTLTVATDMALKSYGLLDSPMYWWLNKAEVATWLSLLFLAQLLAMLYYRSSFYGAVTSTFWEWLKFLLVSSSVLVVYYICQVYVHVFLNWREWLSGVGVAEIMVSISQLVIVAMFSKVILAAWGVLVHVLPLPQYDRPMKRERWHLILALTRDSFRFLFGRSVFFSLRHPAQLALVIFVDYYYDFYHFFLHTRPWFILLKTKLAQEPPRKGVRKLFWILFQINRVVVFFFPERLRAPAGIKVDVRDGSFTSKLMRPRWDAASWRRDLKGILFLKPVQRTSRNSAPPGAVDVRMAFCDRVLFVRVFPDSAVGEALAPDDVQKSIVTVVILQVAIRFHIRIVSKLSASLLFILSRFILAATGGWQFHERMRDHLTTQDLVTLGVFSCMDLVELTIGCWTISRNAVVSDLAGQWLYKLYGAGFYEDRSKKRRCKSSVAVSMQGDIQGSRDSTRRPVGAGFWLFAAIAMHVATDTTFSVFRFDQWCPDAEW